MGAEYRIATGKWLPVRVILSTYAIDSVHTFSELRSLRAFTENKASSYDLTRSALLGGTG